MINKIHIQNFKIFDEFTLFLNDDLNIIVGDNEAGKSTILEAVELALHKRLNGKQIESELSPYIFNKKVSSDYIKALHEGNKPPLPKMLIELFLSDEPDLQLLKGSNNSDKADCVGVKIEIAFNPDYTLEYEQLCAVPLQVKMIPTEYYTVNWYSFANSGLTKRSFPIGLSYIDATNIRLQSGTDYYLHSIINSDLEPKERASLSIAYRGLKEKFAEEPSIMGINTKLTHRKGAITKKDLAISIDVSQKSNWETNLIPHLDDIPFQLIGKGEQNALKIMLALERLAEKSQIILIEEPENHLSFSSMNILLTKIQEKCKGKQIIITTHSTYVLNKLGIEKLIMLSDERKTTNLRSLPESTQDYFRRLSGYDTLRLVLAKKSILVEGPSDELIVQKAFILKHGCLPIQKGVDVINVRGLSFSRFLDIAKELGKDVVVVTDNDKDYQHKIVEKYKSYEPYKNIKICADRDNSANTLEPQILKFNSRVLLNKIFSTDYKDDISLLDYMVSNKTEWALSFLDTKEAIQIPTYVQNAVE